ncbi:HipA domain-containing protein [Mesorhizobium sp. SB112]|uniref:HipA domain-containing protein n=1 Tax=Mesorhizobium sp. SB112 TaxID=3151853 RepID=UPI003266714A
MQGCRRKRRYLLVKRYDRFTDPQGEIRRLHQEDFCQLTGRFPLQKYGRSSTGGGVTLKMMFDAISDLVSPAERLKFLDAVIFNVLICNSDSHAKNYSVLIGASGSARMAPLYDLMCAAVYRQFDQSLPQGIAGRFTAPDPGRPDWQALADEAGLSGAATVRRVEELAALVSSALETVASQLAAMAGDPTRVLERITHEVHKRCRRVQVQARS